MKKYKGSFILLLTALIWGTGFAAQSAASDSIPSFTFNAARSFIAAAFLGILIFLREKLFGFKSTSNTIKNNLNIHFNRRMLTGGFACGCALFIAMGFQQGGIAAYPEGVAASGRSGFLTATYVVMIAFCERFMGRRLHRIIYLAVAVCLAGMYMLCISGGIGSIYFGDLLGLLCAVFFTIQMLFISRFSDCESVRLSFIQFLTAGTLSAISALIVERPELAVLLKAALPILYAGVISSGIGYTLQMEGQKYTEPAVASLILSLESVFALFVGWLILGETLSARELFGCVLVFTAVIMAQLPQFFSRRQ